MESIDSVPDGVPDDAWTWDKDKRKELLDRICEILLETYCQPLYPSSDSKQDKVFVYASELLTLGLFHMDYKDAIKQGDGYRVLCCWKYMMLFFKVSNRKNYSLEALRLLYQYHFSMSPRQKEQLIWSHFINTKGRRGCNIPCDLTP